jgi:dienelactone hydrolase
VRGRRKLCVGAIEGRAARLLFRLALLLCALTVAPVAARSTPDEQHATRIVREQWLIPGPVAGTSLHAQVLRPAGAGPFPLVVINHGSTANAQARAQAEAPQFEQIALWFVRRNYFVLIPQRLGHGQTGGPYLEDYGSCDDPHYDAGARGGGASILAALNYARKQPAVSHVAPILVGHSAGAWAALALASENPMTFRAVINFAGGLGGHSYGQANLTCAPERLIASAADFGATSRTPSLWLYAANDSYFGPALSRQMVEAYRSRGGQASYRLLPALSLDGHFLMQVPAGEALWSPILSRFLHDHAR